MSLLSVAAGILWTVGVGDPSQQRHINNLKCLSRKHQLPETFWTGTEGWADQQMPDGTVIWASRSGHTYVTTPGSTLLFPSLCVPSGEPPVADVPVDQCATVVR
jgi:hypothetical protein